MVGNLGNAFQPYIGALIIASFGWNTLFVVLAGAYLVAGTMWAFIDPRHPSTSNRPTKSPRCRQHRRARTGAGLIGRPANASLYCRCDRFHRRTNPGHRHRRGGSAVAISSEWRTTRVPTGSTSARTRNA